MNVCLPLCSNPARRTGCMSKAQFATSHHLAKWAGATCLHLFVTESFGIPQDTLASCFKKLISEGANMNEPNSAGMTPLHLACQNNLTETVPTLLDFGADPRLKDDEGRTPLSVIQAAQKLEDIPDERRGELELCEARLPSS